MEGGEEAIGEGVVGLVDVVFFCDLFVSCRVELSTLNRSN